MTGKLFFSLSTDFSTRTMNSLGFPVSSAFDGHVCLLFHQQAFGPTFTRITFAAKECAFLIIYVFLSCGLVCKVLVNYQKLHYMITYIIYSYQHS